MKVLVTGGQGFVGRHLRAELIAGGHAVVAPGRDEVDVTEPRSLAAALVDPPDAVVHLAGIAHPGAAAADPVRSISVAVRGTVNLLEAVRAQAPAARVLVVGSSEEYGAPDAADLPLAESAPLRPVTIYAQAKVAQESIALAYADRHGLRVAAVRPFNHSGPGQSVAFILPALANRVLDVLERRSDEIRVGNTHVRRDFTHVRDIARAYRLLLEAWDDDGRVERHVFNVASGHAWSIGDLLAELCRHAGIRPRITSDPELVRPGEATEIRGDPSRLTGVTGWRCEVPIETLLADVLAAAAADRRAGDAATARAPDR